MISLRLYLMLWIGKGPLMEAYTRQFDETTALLLMQGKLSGSSRLKFQKVVSLQRHIMAKITDLTSYVFQRLVFCEL